MLQQVFAREALTCCNIYGLLAQLVEHLTLNQGVRGSSPRQSTKTNTIRTSETLFVFVNGTFGIITKKAIE